MPWTDPQAPPRFPDCDNNGVPDLVDIAMGRLPDENGNQIPDTCDQAIYLSCSDAAPGTVQILLGPGPETHAVTLPGSLTAGQKRDQLVSSLQAAEPQYYPAVAGSASLSLNGLPAGAAVRFSTGDTAEAVDSLTTTSVRSAEVAFAGLGPFEPFDQHGQPALFTAGIVTDVGELTARVSAQELNFQTDGPIICQALFQRLAPRAPQYGAQINYAGDRLEVYFDPAYSVSPGGVVFGTTSRTAGCSGQIVVPCHPADFDCDADVDWNDLLQFHSCASGPAVLRNDAPICRPADFDADNDVDQTDFSFWQRCYSGEGNPSDPGCLRYPGGVQGRVLAEPPGVPGCTIPLEPLAGMELRLHSGEQELRLTHTDDSGRYAFPSLPQGQYLVIGVAPNGQTASGAIDVTDGRMSRLNFLVLPQVAEGIFPSLAGVAVDKSLMQSPDSDGNGVVGLDDLQAAREAGDQAMVQTVLEYFGRAVLLVPGEYQAQVTPGGTRYRIGSDADQGQSVGGSTRGVLTPAGRPTLVRYDVTEDAGTAISQQFGPFNFHNDPDAASYIIVDLDTGLIQEGNLSLRLTGAAFPDVPLNGAIQDGFIAVAPHGFARYHFGVTGVVHPSFPLLGGMVFCAAKSEPPPLDEPCGEKDLSACVRGGKVCKADNASCKVGGKAGICKTTITALGKCSCNCE